MTYKYTATLKDGTTVNGEYKGNGESTQSIAVDGASINNPVVSMQIQQKASTASELAKLKSICKHCNSELVQTSQYCGFVDKLECISCDTKVEVHHQDAMSGCLVDYTIAITKDGITELIDIPFKD